MRRMLLAAASVLGALALASPAPADLRTGIAGRPSLDAATAMTAHPAAALPGVLEAAATLRSQLGPQGVVQLDPTTGAPRVVERLDGFLTAPTGTAAGVVARSYLSEHAALFGATATDVAGLVQTRDYVDVGGTHHILLAQRIGGIPVFVGGVKVNVTARGQVVNVLGSPLHAAESLDPKPGITASEALRRAFRDGGGASLALRRPTTEAGPTRTTRFAGSQFDSASLVYLNTGHGLRLAWQTFAEIDSQHVYEDLVDAGSGALLFRQNIVDAAGQGLYWFYLPDYFNASFPLNGGGLTGPYGTQPNTADYVGAGWLTSGATTLNGANAHVYADLADDNVPSSGDEFPADGNGDWLHTFRPFTSSDDSSGNCSAATPCSWNSDTGDYQTNLGQNATQVFYYVNAFHDHLAASPIGFTAAAGNFQADGGDAVQAQVDDGAATGPDSDHQNNANMATKGDGSPPRMQMYLFTGAQGFVDSNGGDDASIIYHEYTHGLSHRLVTDANNQPALVGAQARAMGEAWSDWYAMDYLIKGCTDTVTASDCWDADFGPNQAGSADVWLAQGVSGGAAHDVRTQPLDCLVGDRSGGDCTGGNTPHEGGYTYADFGQVASSGPEVHADGEIWGETLWQMRQAIGPASYQVSENLVTRGMELAAPDPSFLDARDAILLADRIAYGGAHLNTLWSVFAQRGMGWSARSASSEDTRPVAANDVPPGTIASITGTVRDTLTGAPIQGATVAIAGHVELQAGTDGAGNYSIQNVPSGSYGLVVSAPGYATGTIPGAAAGQGGVNGALTRDWAATSGGARVVGFDGPDLSDLCNGAEPAAAFDLLPRSGWVSTSAGSTQGPQGPKAIVVQLPAAIDVSAFAVDPTAPCGASADASVGAYRIETSPDGATWTVAAQGAYTTNGTGLQSSAPAAGRSGLRFVRFTMLGSQGATGDGKDYTGVAEVEVYGAPTPPSPPPVPPSPGPTTPTGPTTPVGDRTPPTVSQAVVSKQKLKGILRSGLRLRVTCSEACTAREALSLTAAQARRLHLGKRAISLGAGAHSIGRRGTFVLVVKLTAKGRTLVKRFKRLTLTSTATVTDAHGNKRRSVKTLKLVRR